MTGRAWTKAQEQVLLDRYTTQGSGGCIPLLAVLGRIATSNQVASKARGMGLKNEGFTWKGKLVQHGSHGSALKQPPRRVTGPAGDGKPADESRAVVTVYKTPPPRFSAPPGFVGELMADWNRLRDAAKQSFS